MGSALDWLGADQLTETHIRGGEGHVPLFLEPLVNVKGPCSQSKVAGSLPASLITGIEGGATLPESATIGRTGLTSFIAGGAAARVTVQVTGVEACVVVIVVVV